MAKLLNKKAKMFQMNLDNAFLDFLFNGTLQARENLIDSKSEIDMTLKKAFEHYIESNCEDLFGPIRQLVIRLQSAVQVNSDSKGSKTELKEQSFAKPEKLQDAIAENYKDIKKNLPLMSKVMSLYLCNPDIESIVLKRINNSMQQVYFWTCVRLW